MTRRRMIAPKPSAHTVRRLLVLGCLLGICLAGDPAADARDSGAVATSAVVMSTVPASAMAWHVASGLGLRLPSSDRDCGAHPTPPPTSRSLPAARSGHPGSGTLADTGGGRSMAALLMACALLVSGLVFRHAARRRKSDISEIAED